MRKLQENPAAKVAAWILLLISIFTVCFQGGLVIAAVPYVEAEHWQDGERFERLLQIRQGNLASLAANAVRLANEAVPYLERQELQQTVNQLASSMQKENTVFRFQLKSQESGEVVYSNLEPGEELSALGIQIHYAAFRLGQYDAYQSDENSEETGADSDVSKPVYIIECGVLESPEVELIADEFALLKQGYADAVWKFPWLVGATVTGAVLALLSLAFLLWSCGHKRNVQGIYICWQEKIYFEVFTAIAIFLAFMCTITFNNYWNELQYDYHFYYDVNQTMFQLELAAISTGVAVMVGIMTLICRTFTVRCKAGKLLQSTFLYQAGVWLWERGILLMRSLPLIWRTLLCFLGYLLVTFLARQMWHDNPIASFVINTAVLLLLCHWTLCFQRVRRGAETIAGGNLNHQVDITHMPYDLLRHAQALNNISSGMSNAVDEKMKSERFKAELITNVSHDLKTPLTSIINYVSLLKLEEIKNPKAQEYIEVLDRKSQRLKKLTEDLVEASKASTGALAVNREKLGMVQLLDQALGEYEEKLEARRLTVIRSVPEGETYVYADGRHLWRVIDNLLGNCAKYAMEGTRIYLDLIRGKGQVVLSVKNISKDALNVPAEQLMERFVRGDTSRTTEGSGLGLSIARSLTELQGGTFELAVDGDLFKAIVCLPQSA